jgi:hypothetical protein
VKLGVLRNKSERSYYTVETATGTVEEIANDFAADQYLRNLSWCISEKKPGRAVRAFFRFRAAILRSGAEAG